MHKEMKQQALTTEPVEISIACQVERCTAAGAGETARASPPYEVLSCGGRQNHSHSAEHGGGASSVTARELRV
jgi:hypothetical protein